MYFPPEDVIDLDTRVKSHFGPANLDATAINTTYSHVLNPMIVTRSYMCVEPISLYLNAKALRRGIIEPADPNVDPYSLLIHDSGMVPVCTQIAIVNPETCILSRIGEFGEIWVESDANVKGFYFSRDPFDAARMAARIVDGDRRITYARTGDLGFLHNVSRPVGPGGAIVDMQTLFILGSIGETFEVNGLNHFPMDIERTIERSHRKVARAGRYVPQQTFVNVAQYSKQVDKLLQ
jgi:acyl-CoA synthetase (AMP-forming)/AMP-acid ligase II